MRHLVDIKAKNKKNIIKKIHKQKKISKKQIALQLGLSASVMTKLCNELKQENIIIELQKSKSTGVGRKETLMGINYNFQKIIGIYINHKETTLILTDLQPKILVKKIFITDLNPNKYQEKLTKYIQELLKENSLTSEDIMGIGISLKGITDGKHSLSGIWGKKVEFKDYLENRLKIPITLENGVRCTALLENFYLDIKDFILIKYVKAGIGGAIMKNEELLYGESNRIADIGHIIMDSTKDYCNVCKRKGCLESIISYEKLISKIAKEFDRKMYPVLFEICEGKSDNISFFSIFSAAEKGSIKMNKLLRKVASILSIVIINTYSMVDINQIVLTGEIFKYKIFIDYLKSFILEYQFENFWDKIMISNQEESPLASAILVINKRFYL